MKQVKLTQSAKVFNITRLWLVDLQHFDNVMTKFIINKRTDAKKTDVNLLIIYIYFWAVG